MAVHFHPLRVKKVVRETPECISVSFEVPDILRTLFLYKEGQNITLRKIIDGEELRRSYSICSAPYEEELKIAIKKLEGGAFSTFANTSLKAGDTIEVLPPTGKFSPGNDNPGVAKYLAVAAGSGITPVISIIKQILFQNPNSQFTLVFGNRNRQSIIFFEELESLKNKFMGRFQFVHVLSRERTDVPINYGRIDAGKLAQLKSVLDFDSFNDIFICGPEEMIFTTEKFLLEEGIAKNKIHFELFNTPGQKSQTEKTLTEEKDAGPTSKVTIKLDGRSFSFDLGYNGAAILDAALQEGADLPYACKGGVCSTCRAKLVEGEVKMDVNYALEEDELKAGFILTCQSHPVSDKISVDFDVK